MKKLLLIFILFAVNQVGSAQVNDYFNFDDILKFDTTDITAEALVDSTSNSESVAVKICANRDGLVISAEIVEAQTNTTSKRLKELAIESAKKHKFTPDPLAPEKQCGVLTFDFKVK